MVSAADFHYMRRNSLSVCCKCGLSAWSRYIRHCTPRATPMWQSKKSIVLTRYATLSGMNALVAKGLLMNHVVHGLHMSSVLLTAAHSSQDKRSQMLKDVKALSSANGPGLVHFYGAYLLPEAGEVTSPLQRVCTLSRESFQSFPAHADVRCVIYR